MPLTMSDVGTGFIVVTAGMFVIYIGLALHGMTHATIRLIGLFLVVSSLIVAYLQLAHARFRLYSIELVAAAGTGNVDTTGAAVPTVGGLLRTYALRVNPPSTAAAAATATAMRETAFTVTGCGENGGTALRTVQYADVRRLAVYRGSGGSDVLRVDVTSGAIRYVIAAGDTWRILAVPDQEGRAILPQTPMMFWFFDLARVSRKGAATVVDVTSVTCAVPRVIVPLMGKEDDPVGGPDQPRLPLDGMLAAGATDIVMHVWGYGWQ